ncbi:Uncharacterised protein [Chlamydia trachomatis]|nr:Uncharacterised protein [Chlamydia trachomatis]
MYAIGIRTIGLACLSLATDWFDFCRLDRKAINLFLQGDNLRLQPSNLLSNIFRNSTRWLNSLGLRQLNGQHLSINLRLGTGFDIREPLGHLTNQLKNLTLFQCEIIRKCRTKMCIFPTSLDNNQISEVMKQIRRKPCHTFSIVKNGLKLRQCSHRILLPHRCHIIIQSRKTDRSCDFLCSGKGDMTFLTETESLV